MSPTDNSNPVGNPDHPVVPLHQRLRVASARSATSPWPADPAQPSIRQAFMPPEVKKRLEMPLSEIPEFQQELARGRQDAEREGLAEGRKKIDDIVARYTSAIERLAAATHAARMPKAAEIVDLALAVARQLVGRETAVDAGFLSHQIDEALASVENDERLVLRLHPADAERVAALDAPLAARVQIIRDPALAQGGFLIQGSERLIDGTVDARLELVRTSLISLLDAHSPERVRAYQDMLQAEKPGGPDVE